MIVLFSGCSASRKISHTSAQASPGQLRLLGEYILPPGLQVGNTVVGGLSGIDYDSARDRYYVICDDPSSKGPTRYYTLRIPTSENGIDTVAIEAVTSLLNAGGEPYADITRDRFHSADVEALRYDPVRDEMIWSSEGQRNAKDRMFQNPEIVVMNRDGQRKDSFELPPNLHYSLDEKGPRHNSVFEGLSFDQGSNHVYLNVEEPLFEDGPRAGLGDSTAWIRILKFNRTLRKCVAQFAYQVEPVPYPANPPGAFKINGVSDILYLGGDRLLVVERAWSTGRAPSDVRIYVADLNGAGDVTNQPLGKSPPVAPMKKKLLLDFSSVGKFIDNIEGVSFGPPLPNGHKTLLFVADDNFSPNQKSQFLLFEILP